MGILMNLTSRLQAEPVLKESEGKQPEERQAMPPARRISAKPSRSRKS